MLQKTQKSLRIELVFILVMTALIPMTIVTLISLTVMTDRLSAELIRKVDNSIVLVNTYIEDAKEKVLALGTILSADSGLIVDLSLGNFKEIDLLLMAKKELYKVDNLFVSDTQDKIIATTRHLYWSGINSPQTLFFASKQSPDQTVVGLASEGKSVLIGAICPVKMEDRTPLGSLEISKIIDDSFLQKIKQTSGVDITLFVRSFPTVTTLPPKMTHELASEKTLKQIESALDNLSQINLTLSGESLLAKTIKLQDVNGNYLGSLLISTSKTPTKVAQNRTQYMIIITSIILMLIAVFIGLLLARRITQPIAMLVQATQRIASGDLTKRVQVKVKNEIGDLANAFNRMTENLQTTTVSAESYREKAKELEEINKKLKETQSMLIQAGKLTAMGELATGIAHELNQPLTAIRGYAQLILEVCPPSAPYLNQLKLIEEQTDRIMQIVNNIRTFARTSKLSLETIDIHKPIEDALMLLAAQLSKQKIQVIREYGKSLPKIMGDSNQLQQVFINLITNARDALMSKDGGTIWIKTQLKEHLLEVILKDDGPLIPEDILNRIFDPFFTTKPSGQGTGLGLSISYRIIHDHQGTITAINKPGEGVEFIAAFPIGAL